MDSERKLELKRAVCQYIAEGNNETYDLINLVLNEGYPVNEPIF